MTKGSLYCTRPTLAHYAVTAADTRRMAAELMGVVESGAVKILVRQKHALADAADAHRDLEGCRTTGATVLLP